MHGPVTDWRLVDWSAFVDQPSRAAIVSDFDGTLSAVVGDRDRAVPLPGAAETLTRLARRFGLVAVVSGRPVDFLVSALPCGPEVVLAGLYGLQQMTGGRLEVATRAAAWQEVMTRAAAESAACSPDGLEVEDKGLSIVLHWRRAPGTAEWAVSWAERKAADEGLVAQPGRMSVELLPPVRTDKGTVVEALAGQLGAVCFFGDDIGDLPAFATLRRMKAAGKATVAVGVASPEQPAELGDAVDLLVDGPAGVLEVLQALAGGAPASVRHRPS